MADDIQKYMAHHHLSAAHVIGHSMGGKTAMHLACGAPQLVKKLIVADIAPKFYPPHHQDIIDALNALPVQELKSRTAADKALAEHISNYGIRQFLLKNLFWIEKGVLGFRFNLPVLSAKMAEIGANIASTDHFIGPSLFLKGERSEYIAPEDIPEIKRHFPQASIETIENAGHWLHAENPKQFFEKSLTFLNR